MKKLVFLVAAQLLTNLCSAQMSYSIEEYTIPPGQTYNVPTGTSKIAISKLTMSKGSRIAIPADARDFELLIDNGTFASDTGVISYGKAGSISVGAGQRGGDGEKAPRLTFKVNHAKFDFDASSDAKFFSIATTGGNGGIGGSGGKGQNAATSSCNSSGNGHPAAAGGQGAPGGNGAPGNEINARITLVKNHPVLTDQQVQLISAGGQGGPGGPGGPGGNSSPTVCCQKVFGNCVMRRGGNSAGGPGATGPNGSTGEKGPVKLELKFES
jgi:hypothetical protein